MISPLSCDSRLCALICPAPREEKKKKKRTSPRTYTLRFPSSGAQQEPGKGPAREEQPPSGLFLFPSFLTRASRCQPAPHPGAYVWARAALRAQRVFSTTFCMGLCYPGKSPSRGDFAWFSPARLYDSGRPTLGLFRKMPVGAEYHRTRGGGGMNASEAAE